MDADFADTEQMNTRQSDDKPLHVTREIPLWALISAAGAFALQAVALYYGQVAQGEKLSNLQISVTASNAKLDTVAQSQNNSGIKDLEHDFKLNAMDRRVSQIETTLERQYNRSEGTHK